MPRFEVADARVEPELYGLPARTLLLDEPPGHLQVDDVVPAPWTTSTATSIRAAPGVFASAIVLHGSASQTGV
jgi:hypothetical protein